MIKDMAAKTLSQIVYAELKEEPETRKGWDKQTIEYAITHKTRLKRSIMGHAKSMNKLLQSADIEDCFTEVLMYLYSTSDYDFSIATERGRENIGMGVITLEAYVHSCVKFVTLRFVTEKIENDVNETSNTIHGDDGEEMSIFETIPDRRNTGHEDLSYELDKICKYYESYRYKYEVDIFELWFVRLLTSKYGKKEMYNDILTVLGVERYIMLNLQKQAKFSQAMLDIAKAISICGEDEATNIIRNYTYSADKIEKVVQLYEVGAVS